MRKWVCPKCGLKQEAIGNAVAHVCPSNKSQITQFEEVKDDDDR